MMKPRCRSTVMCPGGDRRLGLLAWGRGVGWYLLGIVDTLAELNPDDPAFGSLREALQNALATLVKHQRPDGHWGWAILQPGAQPDSSTTALVAYACSTRRIAGNRSTQRIASRPALEALVKATLPDGQIDGGLGECRGLGIYPQTYGPQPWLQGTATALGGAGRSNRPRKAKSRRRPIRAPDVAATVVPRNADRSHRSAGQLASRLRCLRPRSF